MGYVYDDEGECVIDPDAEVQAAIRDVFAAFAVGGSAYQVVAAFVGRRFPLRAYGGAWAGQLRWGKLTHARALGVLSNPCYTGTYVYGRNTTRRRVQPDGSVRTSLTRVPREQWAVVLHDHHEGYWTWAEYVAAEAKLKANCTHDGARPAREGLALCQGIMFCGSCGRPMTTRYHHDGQAAYGCSLSRADHEATPTCRSARADIVDDAVVAKLLAALGPGQIELALAAADEVAGRHVRSHRAAELAVERAQYDADRAERTFTAVDPENRMVARTLEARWEARLAALDQAQAALNSAREAKPALPDRSALQALAADLPGLWHAPETRDRDRKRLLRTLIADVTLLPEPDRAHARVGVRWHTGATDELALTRPLTSPEVRRTPAAARELIATLRPDHTDEQVVAALADAELTTGTGRPYDVAAVKWVSYTYKIPAPVPFRDGEICVSQAARILGITADAVYYWLTHGRLTARKDAGGRWCIPWNNQVEAACRRQINTSGHLTPRPTTPPQTLPGEVSVQQGAARLGVVEHALYYWIRCGRLTARKDAGGRWCIPWDDEAEAACRDWITHPEQFVPTGRLPLPAEAAAPGEISIPEAAARLGVLEAAVRYQVRIGRLPAHRTHSGRIAIPWNDSVEATLRADLDRPKHPGPTGPGSHPLPDTATARGELSIQQVAARLNVRAGAVYYWIARGRLDAHRAAGGRLSIPWTSDNEAICLQLAAQTVKSDLTTRTLTAGGAV